MQLKEMWTSINAKISNISQGGKTSKEDIHYALKPVIDRLAECTHKQEKLQWELNAIQSEKTNNSNIQFNSQRDVALLTNRSITPSACIACG